ncbi:peptidyl-tRNA hydrolase PTH2-domain-containing protein [Xylariaceae sp. FL1272]|nr:peptidyl-tRNA hydrolase PTH2-domain-containing protein [Xylariaceae sp. FL1272]
MEDHISTVVITTSLVAFFSGFALGIYSIRGYLISPALVTERKRFLADAAESEESDIDENDTILDHAPNWVNGVEADRRQGLRVEDGDEKKNKKTKQEKSPAGSSPETPRSAKKDAEATHPKQPTVNAGTNPNEECKLMLVVRTDLGMTKGKIAAQCSHATLACYKTLSRAAARNPSSTEASLLKRWENLGQAKVAVQVKSADELLTLMGTARSLGITAEVIQDAGRTQIDPGSLTVLGVGPAPKSLVDQVTGGLKLL